MEVFLIPIVPHSGLPPPTTTALGEKQAFPSHNHDTKISRVFLEAVSRDSVMLFDGGKFFRKLTAPYNVRPQALWPFLPVDLDWWRSRAIRRNLCVGGGWGLT